MNNHQARADELLSRMKAISERSNLTRADRDQFDALEREYDGLTAGGVLQNQRQSDAITGRLSAPGSVPEIRGEPGELLVPGQSMTEYVKRAAENGVRTQLGGEPQRKIESWDQQRLNDYWGNRLGISNSYSERALNQDTVGSGVAITPQAWTASVIDFLYADSVLGQLGVTTFPQPTELYNVPQLTAPVQPAWLAESASIGLDANPAFSPVQHNAQGGFKDITSYSVELAQDAYLSGGLPGMLAQSAGRNYALAFDVSGINGVAGNTGNPGLNAETGFVFRHWTSDSGTSGFTPVDTKELSIIAEVTKQKNANVTGFLCNNKVRGTIARLSTATAFPAFWPLPADVADIPFVTTSNANVVPATETDPATASSVLQTTGSYSSIYAGPWAFMHAGMHLDMSTRVLSERYADLGQLALFCMARWSIRTYHPETFTRTIGIITS